MIPGKAAAALIFNEVVGGGREFLGENVCQVGKVREMAKLSLMLACNVFIHDTNPPSSTFATHINSRAEK